MTQYNEMTDDEAGGVFARVLVTLVIHAAVFGLGVWCGMSAVGP